jgi:hypothetical protein
MKVAAIKLARVIALFDTDELTPAGGISSTRAALEIGKKFDFQILPKAGDPADEKTGLAFHDGIWDGTPVLKLAIFNDGIILETNSSTSRSLQILKDSLSWAKQELGLHFEDEMLRRIRYLNTLSFATEAPILTHSQPLNNAANALTDLMASITGRPRSYEGVRIDLDFDHSSDRDAIAPFTIQRLGIEAFDSNRYYSQAPLPTESHIALIERFEADVLAAQK